MAEKVMREHMKERFGKTFNYSENPPLPASLNIELNSTCNQKCEFCPDHGAHAVHPTKPAVMDTNDAKRILDEAARLGIGRKEVGFYLVGEAFLHKDLAEVVAYAKKLGFKYTFLTSNGSLATPDKMRAVLDAGIDSLRFSVNAADRETYRIVHGTDDFDAVCENIKFMRKYIDDNSLNVATSISCVITKRTLGIQKKVKEIFGGYVDDILFIPVMINRLYCDEKFKNEIQLVDDSNAVINRDFICPMLFDTMYVSAEVKVIPCCNACTSDCSFYDLKENFDLESAWNCDEYRRYRNIFLKNNDDFDSICKDCLLRMSGVERLMLED
jgi:MoaA/NifB/PqqE/SkfB family radical SAM enzyme